MSDNGTQEKDIHLIRGDSYALTVGLGAGWDTIVDDAASYQGRLVFREMQDDGFANLLTMTATVDAADPLVYPDLKAVMHFSAVVSETAALPNYDIFHFCEVKSLDGLYARRLFSGKVEVTD